MQNKNINLDAIILWNYVYFMQLFHTRFANFYEGIAIIKFNTVHLI